jgi:DNA-directed RNA polymerase specialized sigma subunit
MALSIKQKERLTDLWKQWRQTKDPDTLDKIFELVGPLMNYHLMQYSKSGVSPEVLELELQNHIVNGLNTYEESKGSLPTYLNMMAKRIHRYVNQNQNTIRLPEKVRDQISNYDIAKEKLTEKLRRSPSEVEIADYMNVPITTIQALNKQMGLTGALGDSKLNLIPDQVEHEVLMYLSQKYSPLEVSAFEYVHGLNGKKTLKGIEIAHKLGVSNSWLSRHIKNMEEDAKQYIEAIL